jgi:hypothetical protein
MPNQTACAASQVNSVHRVQTIESSPMLGGNQAHNSGSYAGVSFTARDAGQHPKQDALGLVLATFSHLDENRYFSSNRSENRYFGEVTTDNSILYDI